MPGGEKRRRGVRKPMEGFVQDNGLTKAGPSEVC